MIGQFVETAQVAQHDFERHVLAHRHHVEVHQRADRILGVGHRGTQLLALLHVERTEHVLQHFARQVGREVGQLVGVELFGRGHQLVRFHRVDQRLAHRVRHFEQDFPVALRAHEIPHEQAVVQRQGFEQIGDVGRVHRVEPLRQLVVMLLRDQRLDQRVTRHFLPVQKALYPLLTVEQRPHLLQAALHRVVVEHFFAVGQKLNSGRCLPGGGLASDCSRRT